MAEKNLVLRLLISAKDEASGVLSSMQAKAAAVAAAIASYFTIDFLSGSVKSAANFEAAMSRVQAATGSAGEELAQLKKAAEDAGTNTVYTSVQAAGALENLAKAGLNANQSMAALPGVLALAAAGDIDLAHAAEIVTRTIAGMGVAVEDTGRIADVLAKGANASNTSVKGLAEALSYTAPTARSAKLSLEQTVAVLGKFADGGIDASRAGTALNAILSQFLDPASKFRSELVSLGITTTDFDKALHQLAASGDKGSKAILAVGTEAGPALRGLINQGMPALEGLKAQLDSAAGSAAETAATMNGNLNGAMNGLSSAWDSLKIKLGEPVLPVITQAVKDLTAGLREGVANGTIGKFGDALRSAFSSGIEWVRKFAAEVDPAALTAKLQDAATKIGAFFDDLGQKATNAGDIVKTAWGVMSAGTGVLMASVYKLGEVFSAIVFGILQDLAAISEGMAKITFGSISEGFKRAAADLRVEAGAAASVAEAYGQKAKAAFEGAVTGAENAREGWAALTAPTTAAKQAIDGVGASASAAAKELGAAATQVETLGSKAQQSADQQKIAAEQARQSVEALKKAYDGLVDAGNTQAAAEKLLEIKKAMGELRSEAKFTADDIKAAYQQMGLASKADLESKAQEFKRHYEAIKSDGTATADTLTQAFKIYAEKAIAANGGVASESIKSEAALRGVRIEADETGKSIVKIGGASDDAGNRIRKNMNDAAGAIRSTRTEAEALQQRLQSLKGAGLGDTFGNQSTGNGTYDDLRKAGVTPQQMQSMGYSSREIEDYINGNDKLPSGFTNRTVTSSTVNTDWIAAQNGLSRDEAAKLREIYGYYVQQANVDAAGRAGGSQGLLFNTSDYAAVTREYEQKAVAEARRLVAAENQKSSTVSAATPGSGSSSQVLGVYRLELNINGRPSSINLADQASVSALMSALETAQLATR
ncbi:MAG: phage tail tape measure protein [Proteobacteria bacterium]|nr:phage tail tape measure protein [Pseudomonadota bacterium]